MVALPRTRPRSRPPAALLALAVVLTLVPCARAAEIMPFDEVRGGMRGEGRTVFSGTTIESFEVEILGKLNDIGADQDLILGRLSGGPLERTGVMAGMSGSPVYIDGKLIGAVAYSWGFASEPIAGITPIEEMLAIDRREERAGTVAWRPGRLDDAAWRRIGDPAAIESFFMGRWRRLFASSGADRATLPLTTRGLDTGWLATWSGRPTGWIPMQGGASAGAGVGSTRLEPGSAVGVKLVRGDVEMTATGTVTWVDGSKVLAFGHPLFGLGAVDLPLTTASVEALLPSLDQSAKMAVPLAEVGALRQDRASGIAGRLGSTPRMVPVRLQLFGPESGARDYSFDIAADPALAPLLLYQAVNGVLNNRERAIGSATVRLLPGSVIKLGDGTDIALDNTFAGANGIRYGSTIAAYLLYLLLNNPWDPPDVDGVNLLLEYDDAPRTARVRRATLSRHRVAAGESVDVEVIVAPYAGPEQVLQRTVRVPTDVDPGPLTLAIGGADATQMADRRRRTPRPSSLKQLIDAMNRIRRNDRVYVVATQDDEGALLGNRRLFDLPPSAATLLSRPRNRGNYQPLPTRAVIDESIRAEYQIEGAALLYLEVDEP